MTLENLLRIKQLREEAPDRCEFEGLLQAAVDRLTDAGNTGLSFASRFDLAYNAAHGLALAALRTCGYRTDKRYLVFQCLVHTTSLSKAQTRVFAICHERRNRAEYEGQLEIDEALLAELISNSKQLLDAVKAMPW
ncbi:MAG: hypothetical protein PVG66_11345 [Chromatiales bacterium]|jgi:hypothetical protein